MNEGNVSDDKWVTAVVTLMGYRRTTLRECPTLKTITRMIVFYGTKICGILRIRLGKQRIMHVWREREREKGVTAMAVFRTTYLLSYGEKALSTSGLRLRGNSNLNLREEKCKLISRHKY